MYETTSIPEFVDKEFIVLDIFFVKLEVCSRSVSDRESEPESICSILLDHINRVYSISSTFTHLFTVLVSDKSMEIYLLKRCLSSKLISKQEHTDNPKEEDIVTCFEHRCRVEFLY